MSMNPDKQPRPDKQLFGDPRSAAQVFLVPDLGEGLVEAELVSWLVEEGQLVDVDQPVAEMETAKSVVEVPSPFAGTVVTLHGAVGDTMAVGAPLITIQEAGVQDAGAGAPPTGAVVPGESRSGGSGSVLIGYGTSGAANQGRRRPAVVAMKTAASAKVAPLVISPVVRKLARDHGIALADINGSGADGLILRSDVTELINRPVPGAAHPRTNLAVTERRPLTGVQKAAAAALSRSRRQIPEATVWVDVDATALMELRASLGARAPGVLAFVARFVTSGLGRFPELNMQFQDQDGVAELLSFDGINLGFAVQSHRGLLVPVLRHAQQRSARDLDEAIRDLADRARAGKASATELSGGTFTINNYGVLGVDGSAMIINFPEAAMLGLGRIVDKPWVVAGELCVRKMTELTLAFDHRVCDGAVAAGFLRFVADAMENPAGVVAEL